MHWTDWLKDISLLVLGGIGTAVWFLLRRKVEQAPVFENIQKAEKLLSLRKELDSTNYTVQDLKNLEDTLMGRVEVARVLSITYEQEAKRVREIEMNSTMTQAEMNIAAGQVYQRAERKLESVIEQMKEFFSPEDCIRFERANDAWRTYQQNHAEFLSSRYEGGSIQPLIYASALEVATVARIVELEVDLRFMKETQVPHAGQNAS